jgi:hypothetical protein
MTDLENLVAALAAFAIEHGTPNNVSPGELQSEFCFRLAPRRIGQLLRFYNLALARDLKLHGLAIVGYGPGEGRRMLISIDAVEKEKASP